MKRTALILLGGLLLALAVYAGVFMTSTSRARSLAKSEAPALAWMREEYGLDDNQFDRLCELHDAYRPRCMEMCRRIDEKNTRLQELLAATNVVTPEIKAVLADAARIRAECQASMLEHFYAVAQTMPPEQGRKYLAWIKAETLKPQTMMSHSPSAPSHHRQ
ncbi:MAG: periplasmic heavy metal sensor [Akkermansiaceae bacterium]|nr:periplasmic heavy metal sensor [Verrucomicrobiales bacterium]